MTASLAGLQSLRIAANGGAKTKISALCEIPSLHLAGEAATQRLASLNNIEIRS
jgi:hypothetical protein